MADINYEELEDLTLTMEDEDGTTTECELQFVFEYDGQDFVRQRMKPVSFISSPLMAVQTGKEKPS